jgi:hypothetical protein
MSGRPKAALVPTETEREELAALTLRRKNHGQSASAGSNGRDSESQMPGY